MSCCEKFREASGRVLSASPLAIGYPSEYRSNTQIEQLSDGSWAVNGCCGGGCFVIKEVRFCPFCGSKLPGDGS